MLSKFLVRLQGLVSRPPSVVFNSKLSVKVDKVPITAHRFIDFKHYTGNEILYSLKDCKKFEPGELSSALLQLGVRKGLPKDYNWENHPCIKEALGIIRAKIPQYTSRVLTSIAHGLNRLNIKDKEIWELLATHITRTCQAIDSAGLAYTFLAFKEKNNAELFENMLAILPVHITRMDTKDLANTVKGLIDTSCGSTFTDYIYPNIEAALGKFGIAQLTEFLKILETRQDFPQELNEKMLLTIEKKYTKKKVISFGGL